MPPSRWSPDAKAEALRLYRDHGPTEAARRTGIPKGTIARWASETGTETVAGEQMAAACRAARLRWEERRLELAHEMGRVAEKALAAAEELVDGRKARDAKDMATAMAILADKAQLLSGGATDRPDLGGDPREVMADARRRALTLVADAG